MINEGRIERIKHGVTAAICVQAEDAMAVIGPARESVAIQSAVAALDDAIERESALVHIRRKTADDREIAAIGLYAKNNSRILLTAMAGRAIQSSILPLDHTAPGR